MRNCAQQLFRPCNEWSLLSAGLLSNISVIVSDETSEGVYLSLLDDSTGECKFLINKYLEELVNGNIVFYHNLKH